MSRISSLNVREQGLQEDEKRMIKVARFSCTRYTYGGRSDWTPEQYSSQRIVVDEVGVFLIRVDDNAGF